MRTTTILPCLTRNKNNFPSNLPYIFPPLVLGTGFIAGNFRRSNNSAGTRGSPSSRGVTQSCQNQWNEPPLYRTFERVFNACFRRKHRGQFNDTRFLTCLSCNGTRFGSVFSATRTKWEVCRRVV